MRRRTLLLLVATIALWPVPARAQGAVIDHCAGYVHRPLGSSPSFVRVAVRFATAEQPVAAALRRDGAPVGQVTAALSADRSATFDIGIDSFGAYTYEVSQGGASVLTGELTVTANQAPCDASTLRADPAEPAPATPTAASTTSPSTTVAAAPSTSAESMFPWGMTIAGGGVLSAVGLALIATSRDRCRGLSQACEDARRAATEAAARAGAADAEAQRSEAAVEQARAELAQAQQRAAAAAEPPDETSWIESEGRRVTGYDLRLRTRAAANAWARYRRGEIDAEGLENDWSQLATDGALEELRAEDAARRAADVSGAQAEVEAATMRADRAREAADAAVAAARDAADAAASAGALADELCARAGDCVEPAVTTSEAGGPAAAAPAVTSAEDREPDGSQTGKPEDEQEDAPPRCGPDATGIYLAALNDMIDKLRAGLPEDLPWSAGLLRLAILGGEAFAFGASAGALSTPIAAGELTGAIPDELACYGTLFLLDNGTNMDYWIRPVPGCWNCDQCRDTVTLLGRCVAKHTLSDMLYGVAAGFFGVPWWIYVAGGQWHEWSKPSGLWIEPQVSRDLYALGADLGNAAREDPSRRITVEDLATQVEVATLYPSCQPCGASADPEQSKNFARVTWVWP